MTVERVERVNMEIKEYINILSEYNFDEKTKLIADIKIIMIPNSIINARKFSIS